MGLKRRCREMWPWVLPLLEQGDACLIHLKLQRLTRTTTYLSQTWVSPVQWMPHHHFCCPCQKPVLFNSFVFTPHILFCHQAWSRLQLNFLRISLFLRTPPPSGWAKHRSHPSSLAPGHTRTLIPCKEQAHPTWGASKQGNRLFVLTPPVPAGAPIKPCLKKKKKVSVSSLSLLPMPWSSLSRSLKKLQLLP